MYSKTPLAQERHLVTAIPGPKSQEALARRAAATSAGLGLTFPVVIERAHGAILEDLDGNRLIDFGSGIGVTNVGSTNDRVVKRVIDQVQSLTHTCFTVAPYMGYIEVCELLNELTPGTHAKKSMLVNSGAEAVENAARLSFIGHHDVVQISYSVVVRITVVGTKVILRVLSTRRNQLVWLEVQHINIIGVVGRKTFCWIVLKRGQGCINGGVIHRRRHEGSAIDHQAACVGSSPIR